MTTKESSSRARRTPKKRPAQAAAVTPSPCKRPKKEDNALKRKDVAFFMCRFRHCQRARDPAIKKDFPAEQEIMLKLRQLAFKSDNNKKQEKSSCSELRDFIKAYGVERNFRGMTADNVLPLLPIVKHIQTLNSSGEKLDATVDPDSVIREVDALADLCKKEGFARNLSFASKALNMLGHVVPIYSSECKEYLDINVSSYGRYLAEWMQEYERHRDVYENVSKRMTRDHGNALETELGTIWFAVRGLDQTMCRVGAPKQVQLLCPSCETLASK